MRRPIILSTALASTIAAGTLLGAPSAQAQETPTPTDEPAAPTPEPTIRTGRTDDVPSAPAPPADPPADVPTAFPTAVRSGRVGDATQPEATQPKNGPVADNGPTAPPDAPAPTSRPTPAANPLGEPDRSNPPAEPTARAASPAPAAPVPPVPATRTVTPGDNLWEIAASHVAAMTGRPRSVLTTLDVAPYWTRVCMANRAHLVSGDVSLIYSGEVIELPEL